MDANNFGAFFKRKRLEKGWTLRQFCLDHEFDPGNISKMERGLLPPPSSRDKLKNYAEALGIEAGSREEQAFFDLADAGTGRIPLDVMTDEQLVQRLPLVFRTLRGQQVPEERLKELAELIRRS